MCYERDLQEKECFVWRIDLFYMKFPETVLLGRKHFVFYWKG